MRPTPALRSVVFPAKLLATTEPLRWWQRSSVSMRSMRSMRLTLRIAAGLLLSGSTWLAAADIFTPTTTGTPPAAANETPTMPGEGIDAIVQVSDAPWMERELTRFAAALGRDPKPLRRQLAASLYHTRSLDSVDTTRPAVFLWRTGTAPLQAIIPIHADRRREFVDEFGVLGGGEPPLVRVGDRDGTVVYSQNHPEGLREYRLLVIDSVAFLARSIDECRKLAARAPQVLPSLGGSTAPVTLTCTGAWLRRSGITGWSWSQRLPLPGWLPAGDLLHVAQRSVEADVESLTFEVRSAGDGRARLTARIQARTDSDFASWIATQQNLGNRLASQLASNPASADSSDNSEALRIGARVVWQDKLERLARLHVPDLRTAYPGWGTAQDEVWMQTFILAGRSTEALWSLSVPTPGKPMTLLALDQLQAEEQARQFDRLASALVGTPGSALSLGGTNAAKRSAKAGDNGPTLHQLIMPTVRQVLVLDGWGVGDSAVTTRGETLARRLQQATPMPTTAIEPTVATLWCDLSRLVRLSPAIDTEVSINPAVITGTLRTIGVSTIQADLTIPLVDAAQALSHLPEDRTAE